jgi:ATP-dependent DNA helicase PIF1
LLNEIRLGSLSTESKLKLNRKLIKNITDYDDIIKESKITPTILYPYHDDVNKINTEHLRKLALNNITNNIDNINNADDFSQYVVIYKCKDAFNIKSVGQRTMVNEMKIENNEKQSLIKILDNACPFDKIFKYIIGAQVMLMINYDIDRGLVNGSRGVIISLSEKNHPTIAFDNGIIVEIKPYRWVLEHPKYNIGRKQYPLTLAWAITIHKSQGATLSTILTDLSQVFAHGQAYVTLSRVKTLEGLFLIAINYSKIKCDPIVKKFYQDLDQ